MQCLESSLHGTGLSLELLPIRQVSGQCLRPCSNPLYFTSPDTVTVTVTVKKPQAGIMQEAGEDICVLWELATPTGKEPLNCLK